MPRIARSAALLSISICPSPRKSIIKKIQQDNQKFIKASKNNNLDIVKSLVKEVIAKIFKRIYKFDNEIL